MARFFLFAGRIGKAAFSKPYAFSCLIRGTLEEHRSAWSSRAQWAFSSLFQVVAAAKPPTQMDKCEADAG